MAVPLCPMNSERSAAGQRSGSPSRPGASGPKTDPVFGPASYQRSGREAVETRGVAAGDLVAILRARLGEIARDDLLRMRPGGRLMGIVGRPHHPVDTD